MIQDLDNEPLSLTQPGDRLIHHVSNRFQVLTATDSRAVSSSSDETVESALSKASSRSCTDKQRNAARVHERRTDVDVPGAWDDVAGQSSADARVDKVHEQQDVADQLSRGYQV